VRTLLLILLLALSGCLSTPGAECEAASCGPAPEPIQAELGGIALEGCRGAQATLNVPASEAQAVVGAAFVPESDLPLAATLLLEPLRCARVVLPDAVAEDVGLLWVSLTVHPANASWSNARVSSYALEVLATDARVADALARAGMPAKNATLEHGPVAVVGARLGERWAFHAVDGGYELAWNSPEGTGARAPAFDRDFWGASPALRRLDVREADTFGFALGQTAGTLTAEGASVAVRLLRTSEAPFLAQVLDDSRWAILASPEQFGVSA